MDMELVYEFLILRRSGLKFRWRAERPSWLLAANARPRVHHHPWRRLFQGRGFWVGQFAEGMRRRFKKATVHPSAAF